MPTKPTGLEQQEQLRLCRELLAKDDVAAALSTLSSKVPEATFELWDAGGLVGSYGPLAEAENTGTATFDTRFEGKIWCGHCHLPPDNRERLEVWLLVMEAFDRRTAEAWTDPLTGLPNRRWLAFELDRRPPALVGFFDVIGLQATNREHGHRAGDQRLQDSAAALLALGGRAFRVGGDEFVVLLADAPAGMPPAPPAGLRGGWGSDMNEAEQRIDLNINQS